MARAEKGRAVPPTDGAVAGIRKETDVGDESGTPWAGLEPRQRIAAEMYATGASTNEIAHAIDVHRTTVFRWKTEVDGFQAYTDFLDGERRRDSMFMTRNLTHTCLHTVEDAARKGDVKVSLGWLALSTKFKRGLREVM